VKWPPVEPLEYLGYQEFVCSETLARELIAGGMSVVNDVPVYLQHVDTMRDGRWIVHVWPKVADLKLLADSPMRKTEMIAA
jgi:hypothetical protein